MDEIAQFATTYAGEFVAEPAYDPRSEFYKDHEVIRLQARLKATETELAQERAQKA